MSDHKIPPEVETLLDAVDDQEIEDTDTIERLGIDLAQWTDELRTRIAAASPGPGVRKAEQRVGQSTHVEESRLSGASIKLRIPMVVGLSVLCFGSWFLRRTSSIEKPTISADHARRREPSPVAILVPRTPCPVGMVLIPAGSFTTHETRSAVSVGDFCLDVHEVTVADYGKCVDSYACSVAHLTRMTGIEETADSACNATRADRQDHPINCVDWFQAAHFCAAVDKRLPTDEEWEWAARGGINGWAYPWGNVLSEGHACWSDDVVRSTTCSVAMFPAGDNPSGVHDLAGNVLEWTASSYNGNQALRSIRGGGWLNPLPEQLTAGIRYGYQPTDRRGLLGFRCAADRIK